jgi:hypothetical protein
MYIFIAFYFYINSIFFTFPVFFLFCKFANFFPADFLGQTRGVVVRERRGYSVEDVDPTTAAMTRRMDPSGRDENSAP